MQNKRTVTAYSIFDKYERLENRLPTREEFELEFYGKVRERNESRYYYQAKRKYLAEKEEI